ncbi:hypothetical protein [Kribbella sp. NPDC051620]|uniref:helix-turn-helix domain-containing protein n=1 Tax=Kribbella sp. NPDC051620 TaxID=3364120 RepID=UPI00378A56BE
MPMTSHPLTKVHRMFELVEPLATVSFSDVVTEAFRALGLRNYWDGYFAGRAAPRRWAWRRPRWCTRPSTTSLTARWPGTSPGCGRRPPRRRR